jgi:hypothetical protein
MKSLTVQLQPAVWLLYLSKGVLARGAQAKIGFKIQIAEAGAKHERHKRRFLGMEAPIQSSTGARRILNQSIAANV